MVRLLLLALLFWPLETLADDLRDRYAAAERFEAVAPTSGRIAAYLEKIFSDLPQKKREELMTVINDTVTESEIRQLSMEVMVSIYTVEEIDAMTAFFGSEMGQSVYRKQAAFSADAVPKLMLLLRNGIARAQAQSSIR